MTTRKLRNKLCAYFYRPSTELWESNVFSRVCLSVQGGGPSTDPRSTQPNSPLLQDPGLSLPPPRKFVQIGTKLYRVPRPQTCSNLFTMKHGLSASGQLAFDWYVFLFNITFECTQRLNTCSPRNWSHKSNVYVQISAVSVLCAGSPV